MRAFADFLSPTTHAALGLDALWRAFAPVSEAARYAARRLPVYGPGDEAALSAHHARLQAAYDWLAAAPEADDRLRHHLRGLPRLEPPGETWEQADLAVWAAFRHHHHAVRVLLEDTPFAAWADLAEAAAFGAFLGDPTRASFYLDDHHSPELAAVRGRLRALTHAIAQAERAQREVVTARTGLPKAGEQWVVAREEASRVALLEADPELVRVGESTTTLRFALKPTADLDAWRVEQAALLAEERRVEHEAYRAWGAALASESGRWLAEQEKLVALDLLLAQARLWRAWGGVLPVVSPDAAVPLMIRAGRFVPLADTLAATGRPYTPLDLELVTPRLVLYGANMGGKTVVLQSVGFLQTLAQLGFAVPAQDFATQLYAHVALVAPPAHVLGGLSSFGAEVALLRDGLAYADAGALYLVDEPGRATHVREGRALAQALIDTLAATPSRLLLATHLDGLGGEGVTRLTMAGLRREALARLDLSLSELMDYRVMEAGPDWAHEAQALDVAARLGLPAPLVERARALLAAPDSERRTQ